MKSAGSIALMRTTSRWILASASANQGPRNQDFFQGKNNNLKRYINEVRWTNALLSLLNIMLCSKLHCQKVYRLKLFS
jgi:hypothetical protein